ncbi:MAG TPA: hypothetical protein VN750_08015 [Steroidobacteraceae bacterium]|nr:hypothetical protein [Steroidobacteraceae bacterium]
MAAQSPQYGLTKAQQQQEYSDISASTARAVNQDGEQLDEDVTAALAQESAQAIAAGSTDTTTESPLTNNVELSSSVPLQPIVGPIQTPSLASIGQQIETGMQQDSLPGGPDQWTTHFNPNVGQQVAHNLTTGDELVWDSTNDEWNPPPEIPEVVVSATREPSAAQYAADQQELENQSNELAREIFGSFGPYTLLKGIYNSGVGVIGDLGYLGVRALGGSTQTADTVSALIDRAQVSPGALEQAMAQSASPYLKSGYQGLASVVGNDKADDLSHVLGLGANALGVAPVVEPLSVAGSSLREGISQLGDIFPSRSAGSFGTGGAPLTGQLGQLNLDAFLPGEEAAPSAASIEALDVPNRPSGLLNGTGEVGPEGAAAPYDTTDPVAISGTTTRELSNSYEAAVRELYGDVPFQQRQYTAVVDGELVRGVADAVTTVDGVDTAVEAKYVADWTQSLRNPDSPAGDLPFAVSEQQAMVDQAAKYSAGFEGGVIYHTNSVDLANYYSQAFNEAGITNFRFVITPATKF